MSDSSPTNSTQQDDLTPVQRQDKKVFYIAKEIMTSEKVYVDVLRLLYEDFRKIVH